MKEVISMWKNTRMIILVALTAAIYAAFLIVLRVGLSSFLALLKCARQMCFPLCLAYYLGRQALGVRRLAT